MGNSTVAGNGPLFMVGAGGYARTIEEAIRAAKRKAKGLAAVNITEIGTGGIVAIVWPNGKVDATFAGSRFVTTWETTK